MVDAEGIITTMAGMGRRYFGVVDGEEEDVGDVYIVDTENHRVRKVDTEGIITTVAGTGEEGFSGDAEPAVRAQLNEPNGVAVDEYGYVYITDRGNNRVRQIDPEGTITTIAGTGEDGSEETMPIQLAAPRGVAVDNDSNLYIADMGNHQIQKVDAIEMTIGPVAGAGSLGDGGLAINARLLEPKGLAIDVDGTIYITDTGNNRIRKVDPEGIITTFAGTGEEGNGGDGGPATNAQLTRPHGVAIGPDGSVYISDTFNNRVRRVDTAGIIITFAGSGERSFSGDEGPAAEAQLSIPLGFEIDDNGNAYLTDYHYGRSRIRKIDTMGAARRIRCWDSPSCTCRRKPIRWTPPTPSKLCRV